MFQAMAGKQKIVGLVCYTRKVAGLGNILPAGFTGVIIIGLSFSQAAFPHSVVAEVDTINALRKKINGKLTGFEKWAGAAHFQSGLTPKAGGQA